MQISFLRLFFVLHLMQRLFQLSFQTLQVFKECRHHPPMVKANIQAEKEAWIDGGECKSICNLNLQKKNADN